MNAAHTPEIIQDCHGAEIEITRETVESLLAQRNELREALKQVVEYLESPPFIALHGQHPAKLARLALTKVQEAGK